MLRTVVTGTLGQHLVKLYFERLGEQFVGLGKQALQVGRLQVLIQGLLAGPVFIKHEDGVIVGVLMQIIVYASFFRAGRLDQCQELVFQLFLLSRFCLDLRDNRHLFVCR